MNSHPNHNGEVSLYYDGNKKLETTNNGVIITGIATATTFVGNLTGDVTATTVTSSSVVANTYENMEQRSWLFG